MRRCDRDKPKHLGNARPRMRRVLLRRGREAETMAELDRIADEIAETNEPKHIRREREK